MFFLEIVDDQDSELELLQPGYRPPIPEPLRWRSSAADPEGITGDELLAFANGELFPKLRSLPTSPKPGDRRRVVKDVFEDAFNYMTVSRPVRPELAARNHARTTLPEARSRGHHAGRPVAGRNRCAVPRPHPLPRPAQRAGAGRADRCLPRRSASRAARGRRRTHASQHAADLSTAPPRAPALTGLAAAAAALLRFGGADARRG